MKKIILIAMLVAFAGAATMSTYRTAFSQVGTSCAFIDNNNSQVDVEECELGHDHF
jgi:hypothetical protein